MWYWSSQTICVDNQSFNVNEKTFVFGSVINNFTFPNQKYSLSKNVTVWST